MMAINLVTEWNVDTSTCSTLCFTINCVLQIHCYPPASPLIRHSIHPATRHQVFGTDIDVFHLQGISGHAAPVSVSGSQAAEHHSMNKGIFLAGNVFLL